MHESIYKIIGNKVTVRGVTNTYHYFPIGALVTLLYRYRSEMGVACYELTNKSLCMLYFAQDIYDCDVMKIDDEDGI